MTSSAALALAAGPTPAVAAASPSPAPHPSACFLLNYTWTGAVNNRFDNLANWNSPGGGYLDDCSDDAVIPDSSGGYAVELIDEQIDDLTIEGSVDFTPVSSPPKTLTVDSLTIVGGGEITFNGARVRTQTCPN